MMQTSRKQGTIYLHQRKCQVKNVIWPIRQRNKMNTARIYYNPLIQVVTYKSYNDTLYIKTIMDNN